MADSIARWENEGGAVADEPAGQELPKPQLAQSSPNSRATVLRAAPAAPPASSSS
jgi:hypothetical protein